MKRIVSLFMAILLILSLAAEFCDNSNAIAPSYFFILGHMSCVTFE